MIRGGPAISAGPCYHKEKKMEKKKLEILAPAGSFESLKAAVHAGADAVYMGGSRFGARAYAQNPEGDRLLEAIDYAHLYGVKLYLTVNTLLKDKELEGELYDYLKPCVEHGLDAVIVQDTGVMKCIQRWFPELDIHASTQMTLCGVGGVELLKEEGAHRAVLARELSLDEIHEIYEKTGMELECFVHGALCYCYSGQCLFSSLLGGRSGNRGRCAQPCRLAYTAADHGKNISGKEQDLLSPKDLCALDLIPQIAEAGVYSLKIEGRMKRPEYTAGVVRIYRKYVDQYLKYGRKGYKVAEADRKELLLLFNRDGFSTGYYEKHNGRDLMALYQAPASDSEKKAYEKKIAELHQMYVEQEKRIPVHGYFYGGADQPLQLTLTEDETGACVVVTGGCPQAAQNRPTDQEQVEKQLKKLGGTSFVWESLDVQIEDGLFIPVQELNNLRREGITELQKELLRIALEEKADRQGTGKGTDVTAKRGKKSHGFRELHISVETEKQLAEVLRWWGETGTQTEGIRPSLGAVYLDAESLEEDLERLVGQVHSAELKAYVVLPAIFRKITRARYEKKLSYWQNLRADGYVIRNLEEYEYVRDKEWAGDLILDHNVYTFNQESREYWRQKGVMKQTSPLELNGRELANLSDENSIQIVYGRYPMMTTAGCVRKTLNLCRHEPGVTELRDRKNVSFPVKNYCRDCYNVIYNSQPLYLFDRFSEVEALGAGVCRIMFTTETVQETRLVLNQWLTGEKRQSEFTRGHFARGVE